jgi:uncharacterized membrane protein
MAQWLRGTACLVAATIGAVLFGFELLLGRSLAEFVGANHVELDWRMRMLRLLGVLVVVVAGGSAVACRAWGPALAARLERAGVLALPSAMLCVLPPLLTREPWRGQELEFLITVGAFGVALEAALRCGFSVAGTAVDRCLQRVPIGLARWAPRMVIGSAVAYYAIRISALTLLSHQRLATSTSDLGEFDNLFFNALHGHPFRAPAIDGDLRDWGELKVHAEFVLYLLLPLYALRPGPRTLLVIQSTVVALTAIPIFLFAARRAGRAAGVVLAVVFLLLPFVERPNFYDFHFVPVGMLFAACTITLVERQGTGQRTDRVTTALFWVSFALTLLSREDIAAGMVVTGLFVALTGHNPRLGTIMALAAGVYCAIVKFIVMPHFGVMWFDSIYDDLKVPDRRGFASVVYTLVSNPVFTIHKLLTEQKLLYVLHLTVPLLFLWLRRWPLLAAALPGFLFTLAVTNRPPMSDSSFQYAFLWAPYVVTASALALERIGRRRADGPSARRAALAALAAVATITSVNLGAFFGAESIRGGFGDKVLSINDSDRQRASNLGELLRRIPPDSSVVASEDVGPHVSTRLVLYSLKYTLGDQPDYMLVGRMQPSEQRRARDALAHGYGVIEQNGEFFLAKRGAPQTDNASLAHLLH